MRTAVLHTHAVPTTRKPDGPPVVFAPRTRAWSHT
jgi:hypothetical protein